jgi:hypothetical protein
MMHLRDLQRPPPCQQCYSALRRRCTILRVLSFPCLQDQTTQDGSLLASGSIERVLVKHPSPQILLKPTRQQSDTAFLRSTQVERETFASMTAHTMILALRLICFVLAYVEYCTLETNLAHKAEYP